MKKIGQGSFTKAFLRDDGKVQLHSVDPIKECMSFGWFPSSRLFPTVTRINTEVYEMKHFPKVASLKKSLKAKEYQKYLELRNLSIPVTMNIHDGYDSLYNAFCTIKNKRLRAIMLEALDACSNYGSDIGFEISPRNVAVTTTGNLILLDCFFMKSKLDEVKTKRY